MPRLPDSGQLDLAEVFYGVQEQLLAQISVGGFFEHPSAAGTAAERPWLDVLSRYLPKRFSAAPAFVIDSEGRRSRQTDLAIFDNLASPLLFPHEAGIHIPVESVYAVFEIKPSFSRQWIRDAALKAASVRVLRPTTPRRPILAGLLATTSVWTRRTFEQNLKSALTATPLDLGCSLEHGSFEKNRKLTVSIPEESLIFFILRLLDRLNAQPPARPPDLMKYGRYVESFK